MTIRVGTSGWSYDDWQGTVYPPTLPQSERLKWMTTQLPTVEIDSTYYRDPAPGVVKGWIERTRDTRAFELSAKAPQTLTHELLVGAAPDECARAADAWASLVARPLASGGRLGAILLQLSPAVLHTRDHMARLDAALAALAPLPVAVEFRNRTWHDEAGRRLKPDALALLDERGVALVATDGPGFPDIVEGSAEHAYVRFHGRNREHWFAKDAHRDDRYRWAYTEDELAPWADRLARLAREKSVVRVYFNNHVEGQAFRNALTFESMLEARSAPLERAVSPQRRLPF